MRRVALSGFCMIVVGCGGDDAVVPDAGGADAGLFDSSTLAGDAGGGLDAGSGAPCRLDSDCDDGVACTIDRCNADTGLCRRIAPDADGDGHGEAACTSAKGTPLGDDCDDADPLAYTGATEVCDAAGRDEDCDSATYGTRDADGDSSIDIRCCNATTCGSDCDDMRSSVHPSASEACDGLDNDCNGLVDDATLRTWYRDADHDGFGISAMPVTAACAPADYASVGGDCNDTNASVNPGTAEVCNGIDDNCVGGPDEGVLVRYYADCDRDGWGAGTATLGCAPPMTPPASCSTALWLTVSGDCNDDDASVHPGSFETCNRIDDDCDRTTDEPPADAWCNAPAQLAPLHATAATCDATGACASTACASPFLDCAGAPGCETNGGTDRLSCGMCGRVCDWGCTGSLCDGVVELSAGGVHTCARRASGAVDCWGLNDSGQVGDGTTVSPRGNPTAVLGLADAVEIEAGYTHTCARRAAGAVVCWGRGFGPTPVAVLGLVDATEIEAGVYYTCTRRASGAVVCWGSNSSGQLGDGTTTDRSTPVAVLGLADAVEISADFTHTCARRASGAVVCWGSNTAGELGDGTTTGSSTPVAVLGLADAVEISAGGNHTCARRASGAVVCWGYNGNGELGDGTTTASSTPVAVSGLADAVEISAGGEYTCARRASGAVVCWGRNRVGALGDGTTISRSTPVSVSGLADALEISAGVEHTCARRASGVLVCWGRNEGRQLGDRTSTDQSTPVTVLPPP